MKIIGFNINKILIERKNPIKGRLEIKSNLDIKDIQEEKVPIFDKQLSLKFDFSFTVDYNPNIAKIEVNGSVITLEEKLEFEEILKDWKKKKFPSKLKIPLFNFILNKCNIKVIPLEEEMGLPLHIPFPKLRPEPERTNKSTKSTISGPANYTG